MSGSINRRKSGPAIAQKLPGPNIGAAAAAAPESGTRRGPSLSNRDDVRIHRLGGRLYVYRSDGPTLRLRESTPGVDGPVDPAGLTDDAVEALTARGLLVPSDGGPQCHPSYPHAPVAGTGVRVLGGDPVADLIASHVQRAGVSTATDHDAQVLVVGLGAPDEVLVAAACESMARAVPVVVHLSAGARLHWAVLRPPATPCPLCLSVRIRAGLPGQLPAGLGLGDALGGCADTRWPTTGAGAALVAHQAVRLLTGAVADGTESAGLVELDLDSATSVRHALTHTPRCPACEDSARRPPDPAPVTPEQSWERMSRAIDPLTGIVTGLVVIPPDDPRTGVGGTVAWARGGTDTRWFSSERASTVGGATKDDPVLARVCALGEVLERYAAGIHRPEDFVRASLSELGSAAVDPRSLPLGTDDEYAAMAGELVPYRPELVIDWVRGRSLGTGQVRYLPAAAVHVPYRAPNRAERLLHPNSTGLAAGADWAHATFAGLCEVIERDAAAVYWYNRLITPTLDLDALPAGPAATVLARVRQRGIRLLAKDITTDLGIPAVLLRARFDESAAPVALCSFRADISLSSCLVGAAQELEHLLAMYHRAREEGRTVDPSAPPRDIWDFATYYCHDSRIGALDFMSEGPTRTVPAAPEHARGHEGAVAELVRRLAGAGYDAVTVDLTPIDVAECGAAVVRTVVPGLQPVSFHPRFRHLGGPRVYSAPVRMGLRDRELTEHELNPDPVPLG